eukprot:CCRYP_018114-RA/>CCRYP_018114-RA protein AED:0.45 eAED:0.72 QI:0/0/0/1/0/0/2/0/82
MDCPKYNMRLKFDLSPEEIVDKYKLCAYNKDGWVYMLIDFGIRKPSQQSPCKTFGKSGILPVPILSRTLAPHIAPHHLLFCG